MKLDSPSSTTCGTYTHNDDDEMCLFCCTASNGVTSMPANQCKPCEFVAPPPPPGNPPDDVTRNVVCTQVYLSDADWLTSGERVRVFDSRQLCSFISFHSTDCLVKNLGCQSATYRNTPTADLMVM